MKIEGEKVLVTGADGFIGSHLAEGLIKAGADVRALVLYNSMGSWGWLEKSEYVKDMEIVAGDVRDPHCCNNIAKDIDVIFNLAALIAIPYSYTAPNSYVDTNIIGALNICQAARTNSVSRVLQISTSEVYGTAQYVPINEKHPLQPQSPYSASKIGSDALAMSFYNSFALPVIIARPFNTYGPRQSARAIIPTIITQIATGQSELKLGNTSPTRDMSYVSDTCRGLIMLAECERAVGKTVNIGSNFEISIGEIVSKIKHLMNSDIDILSDEERIRPPISEVERLWCDNSLVRELTGFEPRCDIDAGLKKTIDWFSDNDNLAYYKGDIYNV